MVEKRQTPKLNLVSMHSAWSLIIYRALIIIDDKNKFWGFKNASNAAIWHFGVLFWEEVNTIVFGLNLFILYRLRNKLLELIQSRSRCLLPGWTSPRAHCVVCERHEVRSRRRRDSNPCPSDLWSDTLPLDQLSSKTIVFISSKKVWFIFNIFCVEWFEINQI